MKQNSKFRSVSTFALFVVIGLISYQFGRNGVWFVAGLMLLLGIILEKAEEDISFICSLREILIVIALMTTGIVQIISELSVQTLFLQVSTYTVYHLAIHLIWSILWIILAILYFVSSNGVWNLIKLLKSFVREGLLLLPFAIAPILLQLQHLH